MRTATRLAPWLACVLWSVTAHAAEADALKAGIFDPAREAPDFSVRGSDGTALTLSRYRGKVVVLGFGYTSCPNVCPVTLAVLAQAHRKLGALGSQVQIIYLTVDPERDSAERLKELSGRLRPQLRRRHGHSPADGGGAPELWRYRGEAWHAESDYAVAHSSFVYLITRDGKLRALMPFGHMADDYVHDIAMLLN